MKALSILVFINGFIMRPRYVLVADINVNMWTIEHDSWTLHINR